MCGYEEGAGAPAESAKTAASLLASASWSVAAAVIACLASDAFLEWVADSFLECPRERTLPPAFDSGVKDPAASIGCAC